jgi:hypothetical protein
MFSRNVSMRLKPNSVAEFTKTLENEIIPLLRKQKGFQDEITFVVPGGTEAVGVSLWDQKENAEAYDRGTYPQVLNALSKVIEGTPTVQGYEVSNSTFHKIAARVAA